MATIHKRTKTEHFYSNFDGFLKEKQTKKSLIKLNLNISWKISICQSFFDNNSALH